MRKVSQARATTASTNHLVGRSSLLLRNSTCSQTGTRSINSTRANCERGIFARSRSVTSTSLSHTERSLWQQETKAARKSRRGYASTAGYNPQLPVVIKTGYGPLAIGVAFAVGLANGFLLHHYYTTQDKPRGFVTTGASLPMVSSEINLPVSELTAAEDRSKLPGSVNRRPIDSHFIADAAKAASPAVVAIQTEVTLGGFYGVGQTFGSGFIIDPKGTIVTNAHVVSFVREKTPVTVRLSDGTIVQASVVARDDMSDLAVLRIINKHGKTYPCAKMGSSSSLCPGEWVTAIGSPLTLQNSVTSGVVSNVDRSDYELGIENRMSYLQFDAGITSGNSGGPLVNLDGEVVGVNCMKAMDSNIGFAIPIDAAKDIIKQLLKKGKVERPYVGVTMVALNTEVKEELQRHGFNIPADAESGVLIVEVVKGAPVAEAGLKSQDIIIAINGHQVRTSKDVLKFLGEPGKPNEFQVRRGKEIITREVVPTVLPERFSWGRMGGRGFP